MKGRGRGDGQVLALEKVAAEKAAKSDGGKAHEGGTRMTVTVMSTAAPREGS